MDHYESKPGLVDVLDPVVHVHPPSEERRLSVGTPPGKAPTEVLDAELPTVEGKKGDGDLLSSVGSLEPPSVRTLE